MFAYETQTFCYKFLIHYVLNECRHSVLVSVIACLLVNYTLDDQYSSRSRTKVLSVHLARNKQFVSIGPTAPLYFLLRRETQWAQSSSPHIPLTQSHIVTER